MWIKVGILPHKSSRVCILIATRLYLPEAHAARFILTEIEGGGASANMVFDGGQETLMILITLPGI